MTPIQLIMAQDKVIQETKILFQFQDKYWADRTEANLQKVRIQQSKVKQLIEQLPKR